MLTDGEPTDGPVCPDMTLRMNQSDVDIVIILIDPDNNINESSRDCLDVKDNGQDVIRLSDFSSNSFNAIEQRIRDKYVTVYNLKE